MAKNSRKKIKKEIKMQDGKKTLVKKFLRIAAVVAIIAAAGFAVRNSRYFKLDSIEVTDISHAATGLETDYSLQTNKGRNIFDIDIAALASRIENAYPAIKKTIVKRILPNRLEIDVIPRIPVAKIKDRHGYFPVDRTGMVLSPDMKSGRLPVIIGFSLWRRPNAGERLKNEQMENAFRLIDAASETSVSQDYIITTIDASNYRNLSLYLDNGIEAKIGGEDFLGRLKKLKEILADPDLDKANIRYIDLRFEDAVIGPK